MNITTTTTFRITALAEATFVHLFALTDAELAARAMRRVVADSHPGFPCRVSLRDAEPGERLILLHHAHHDVRGPYRGAGPIYVREAARAAAPAPGEVPEVVRRRLLSLRGYDATGWLLEAQVAEGRDFESVVERLFADPQVAYLHVHNAGPGCYNCRVERA
jgi:hypothetical protein